MKAGTLFWIALLAWPVAAQEADPQEPESAAAAREEVLAAIELPAAAQALRNKGVDKAEVGEALRAAKGKRVKARNAKALLDESATAVDENGKIDNFGAFVKAKLNEGLRGRELAAAIRAEHKKRGKGKAKGKGASSDDSDGKGKSGAAQSGKDKPGKDGKDDKATDSGKGGDTGADKGGGKGKGHGKNR